MRILLTAALMAAAFAVPNACQAQALWNPNYPQSWPPGAYQPTGRDLPFSERYGYYSGPAFYYGMTGRQAFYLEYLDRVDRAERFGRPIPPPPVQLSQPPMLARRRFFRSAEPIATIPAPTEETLPVQPAPKKRKKPKGEPAPLPIEDDPLSKPRPK